MALKANSDPPLGLEFTPRHRAELGLALIDPAFGSIALDEGAAAILSAIAAEGPANDGIGRQRLPAALMEQVRHAGLLEKGSNETRFIAGNQCYCACAHLMQSADAAPPRPWIVLRFQRDADASDALAELGMTCHLTDREKEALRAIALGLTGKEVAQRMNISLSTLKVFLRLIKIKTGGRNRANIVARLLSPASNTSSDPRDRSPHYQGVSRIAV